MTLRFLRVGAPAIFPSCSSSFALRSSSVTRLDEKRASPPGGASGEEEEAPPRWPWYRCAHRQSCVDHSRSSGSATLAAPSSLRTRYASWISLNFSCAPSSSRAMSGWYRRHRRRNARFSVFSSEASWGAFAEVGLCFSFVQRWWEQKGAARRVMREAEKHEHGTTRAGPGKGVGVRRDVVVVGRARVVDGAGRRGRGIPDAAGRPAVRGGADVGASRTRRDAASEGGGIFLARREEAPFGGLADRGSAPGCRAFAARVPRLARGVFGRTSRVRPMSSAARRRPSSVQIFASIATPRRARRRARPPPRRGAAL